MPLEAPDVAAAAPLTVHEQARMEQFRKDSFVGTGPEVAARIRDLAAEVGVHEMAVVTWTHDEEVRRESYTQLARAMGVQPEESDARFSPMHFVLTPRRQCCLPVRSVS